jgi:hypothetical protein
LIYKYLIINYLKTGKRIVKRIWHCTSVSLLLQLYRKIKTMLTVGFSLLMMATFAFWQRGLAVAFRKMRLGKLATRQYLVRSGLAVGGWLAYLTVLSETEVLTNMAVPLRIPVLVVLPLVGLAAYAVWSPGMRRFARFFPKQMTVYGQTMRIALELLVYGSYVQGVVPAHATFEGYNLGILVGLSAPLVGCLAFLSRSIGSRTLLAWNAAGLVLTGIELCVFVSTIISPELCGFRTGFAPDFGTMPYLLLLAVFIPSAVSMHLVSIAQILTVARRRAARQEYA